ncbi:MAG: DUF3990 domain-containing protein [Tannerella sp.]|nr:DUF3990 domain-containing protein [Tannerella sp.]
MDLTKGRNNLDFGKDFYVTGIRLQAEFWAARTGRFHKTEGVVSEFEFYLVSILTQWILFNRKRKT